MGGEIKFKKQNLFPYLEEYSKRFPITSETIFVFNNTIFSSKNETDWLEYYDILYHEIEHIKSQNEIGGEKWINLFLNDKDFRLEEEKRAYTVQLQKVKEMGDREEYMNIFTEVCQNISSPLYGSMISYRNAEKYFKAKII